MRGRGRKEGGGQFQAGIFTKRDAKNAISKVAAAVGMLDLCTKKAGSPKWYHRLPCDLPLHGSFEKAQ